MYNLELNQVKNPRRYGGNEVYRSCGDYCLWVIKTGLIISGAYPADRWRTRRPFRLDRGGSMHSRG